MFNQMTLRLKLLMRDRLTCIVYIITAVVFTIVLSSLNIYSEERSSIPIGLICLDESISAGNLRDKIKSNDSLYVYEGDFEKLEQMMTDGYINSIYVIDEDYEHRIKHGDTDELIKVYSCNDDRISVLVTDIIAGSMLEDICLNISYNIYKKLDTGTELSTREEYENFEKKLMADPSYGFSFDTEYRNIQTSSTEKNKPVNAIIYRQMIAGMIAMLLSLVVFFIFNSLCLEKEHQITGRRRITPAYKITGVIGELLASVLYTLPLSLIIAVFITDNILHFANVLLISIIYIIIMSLIFLIVASLLRSVTSYQFIGAVIIVVFGAAGFYSVFVEIISASGGTITRLIPNSKYIDLLSGLIS